MKLTFRYPSAFLAVPLLLVLAIGCGGGGSGGTHSTTATGTATGTTATGTTSSATGTSTSTGTATGSTGSSSFTATYITAGPNGTANLLVQQGLNAAVAIGNGPMSSFYGPSLSPDKSSVVVIQSTVSAGQPSINDLYLYKTSGGMQTGTQITHGGQIGGGTPYGPSCIWNPQGTKILFTNTDSSIWEVGVNGSGLTQISPSSAVLNGFPIEPSWSPDGTKISFGENNSVYVVNADGSNPQNVYTLPTGNNNGATSGHFFAGTTWGLDSSYVYFIDAAQLDPNIPTITSSFYKVPPTTGNSPTLVSTLTWTVAPAFSPSGQMVASLVLGAGFLGPVQSMGLTGANQVTVDNGQDFRWTKNNQLVIYDGQGGLWLASPTSGAAETLIVQLPSPGVQIFSGFDAR